MTFSEVLPLIESHKFVRREAWEDNQHLKTGIEVQYKLSSEGEAVSHHFIEPIRITQQYSSKPWNPTLEDLLAEDWVEWGRVPCDKPTET